MRCAGWWASKRDQIMKKKYIWALTLKQPAHLWKPDAIISLADAYQFDETVRAWCHENAITVLNILVDAGAVTSPRRIANAQRLRYWDAREKGLRRAGYVARLRREGTKTFHGATGEDRRFARWRMAYHERQAVLARLLKRKSHTPFDLPSGVSAQSTLLEELRLLARIGD
jgi:hypothetical protein